METTTVYSEDSRQRIQNRIASAVKTKLMGNGIENVDELSVKFTEMMASGHSKEEVLAELEKYTKNDESKTLEQIERHNKSFVDWLFGYSSVVAPKLPQKENEETPLTEADTETAIGTSLNDHQTKTAPIEDVTEDEDDGSKKKNKENEENEEKVVPEIKISDNEEQKKEELKEEPKELEPKEVEAKKEESKEETKTEEPKEEEKKPEIPKRRSFIRIKEGKSGRFTPIKSEDRHSFVKRNLTRHATQLDVANQVQKKMMSHAVAVANASESLTKKKSNASLNGNNLEKKKSFRRDSNASNSSSTPSIYSSTNATFIQSFAGKTFPKTANSSNASINNSTVTPEPSKVIRCTYWPNCSRGDECKFWHPKELCANLTNCPYGDECLYIHPAIPQNQLSKSKKKSESKLEVSDSVKHISQKKLTKRESMASIASNSSQSKKSSKSNSKENTNGTANGAVNASYAIECKFGANCTRPDCKYSHPSPAAILAAKKAEVVNALKKRESGKLKEKKSHEILKHKESRSKLTVPDEAQTILCRFDPKCKRENCRFLHTNK